MRKVVVILSFVLVLSLFQVKEARAGGHSVAGLNFSQKEAGIVFGRLGDDYFNEIKASVDLSGVMRGWVDFPGYKVSFARHITLYQKDIPSGSNMRIIAGPGVMAGYLRDNDTRYGTTLALSGHLGVMFVTPRSVILQLRFSTELGLHHTKAPNGGNVLRPYYNGLIRSYMPELSVSYMF